MKKVYNSLTGKSTLQSEHYDLKPFEVSFYDELVGKMGNSIDYARSREELIVDVLEKNRHIYGTQKTKIYENKLGELHKNYFKPELTNKIDGSVLNSEFNEIRSIYEEGVRKGDYPEANFSENVVRNVGKLIDSMTNQAYSSLLELSVDFKPAVFLTIQPALINAMGYKDYSMNFIYLISEKGLYNLFVNCKGYNHPKPYTLSFFNDFIAADPVKVFGITTLILLPICYFGSKHIGFLSMKGALSMKGDLSIKAAKERNPSLNLLEIFSPDSTKKRPGFDSDPFKDIRPILFKCGAEIGQLTSSLGFGILSGVNAEGRARLKGDTK
jgi:hypothetical protein